MNPSTARNIHHVHRVEEPVRGPQPACTPNSYFMSKMSWHFLKWVRTFLTNSTDKYIINAYILILYFSIDGHMNTVHSHNVLVIMHILQKDFNDFQALIVQLRFVRKISDLYRKFCLWFSSLFNFLEKLSNLSRLTTWISCWIIVTISLYNT